MTRMCRDCECCDEHDYCSSLNAKLIIPFVGGCSYFRRKDMNIKEAYEVMQAACGIEKGDTVKVLRVPKHNELGSRCDTACVKTRMVGNLYKVDGDYDDTVRVNGNFFPFFCLELVKKAEPTIEITVKVNGKKSKLSDISRETLLNIRNKT